MTEKIQKYNVSWDSYPPIKRWLIVGLFLGVLIFLDSNLPEGESYNFSSWLFIGIIFFSQIKFFPVISRNYFIDIFIALILSFLIAYFLGPIFYKLLGGDIFLEIALVSPLYLIAFISALREWKTRKSNPEK